MKATTTLLATALAAAGLMAAGAALADGRGGHGGHGGHGGSGGHWSGGHTNGGQWRGGANWNGRGVAVHNGWRGGHWGGGHWVGSRWYDGPRWGFYLGVPVFWGPWDPFYSPYYYAYPRETVVYREALPDTEIVETIREAPPAEGAAPAPLMAPPASGPMSMSYCASAKAYFPHVRSCPEGWSATLPTR